MSSLVSIVFNLELSLVIAIVTSFVLGFLLLLIKVPNTEYSRKIMRAKRTIASCFFICTALFYICLQHSGTQDYEHFASMMMFVITAIASPMLSFSLLNLLYDNYVNNDKFYLNVGVVSILGYLLIQSFGWENHTAKVALIIVCIALYLFQCVFHIIVFDRIYVKRKHELEQYYDEEEDSKIKWVRFCYVMMMLTQMFVLVYMVFPAGWMKVYVFFYSLFMLYFSANFISFVGSHKLLLDAFAYKVLSGQEFKKRPAKRKKDLQDASGNVSHNESEYRRLERALERWVAQKRFCEYDKSREEIAQELNTTKEFLYLYFTTEKKVDFKTWRTQLRIEESKTRLLENKDLSINIVGEMCGFSDRSNFHRQFVKIVGCSPKQWRDSNGNSLQL